MIDTNKRASNSYVLQQTATQSSQITGDTLENTYSHKRRCQATTSIYRIADGAL